VIRAIELSDLNQDFKDKALVALTDEFFNELARETLVGEGSTGKVEP
jgi:hypothetical protein